ncbi:hypothetical protein [Haloechinothrix halophila]|uniref:hypothetical protein n=1 Tax=Haloechinothrix halophila TaxID=1069073 RepID=UPI0012FB595C|nr:hypothetical protein [Haloechinothrix halophila]
MNWFFLLVIALACAPVLGCLWWVLTSKIRDRRRTRIAERMSATYYHEAIKVPGREERRSRRSADAESTGERAALRDTGERAAVRRAGDERAAARRMDDEPSDVTGWPADEPDLVEPEPVCCTPRQVAHHDGPCDCWEDTEVFELRDGLPAVPLVPRRAAGPPPRPSGAPPAVPPGMPPAAGPPPRRPSEWHPPERPHHPMPRNPVERRSVDAQRPPAARPAAERPVQPRREGRPADRPQRPPAQRRERYPADRRDGRPAQRDGRRPVERTAVRQPADPYAEAYRDAWPPPDVVGEPARSGKHHLD